MNGKKLLLVVLVLFLGFWMFHDPQGLAHATKSTADGTFGGGAHLFGAVLHFVKSF